MSDPRWRVGVVGHGYVGSATAHALSPVAEVVFHDPAVPGSRPLAEVADADVVYVCVPTPSRPDGRAELSIVREIVDGLARLGTAGPVAIKSTVPPGTTERLARDHPRLRLFFSPEFLRERHHLVDAAAPARVVLGWTDAVDMADRARVRGLYRRRFPEVPVVELTATAAELLKYASNALFGVKVSFANEMAELAGQLGVDWEPVREALVLDPRVGDGHLRVPGPDGGRGFGGSCLPKDMAALLATAADAGVVVPVVEAAVRANGGRRG